MSTEAWKVTINECEWVYVLADDPEAAEKVAVREWAHVTGNDPAGPEFDPATLQVDREPRLDGSRFSARMLVHLNLACWECTRCGHMVRSGEYAYWYGDTVVCDECGEDAFDAIVERMKATAPPSDSVVEPCTGIYLTTEY